MAIEEKNEKEEVSERQSDSAKKSDKGNPMKLIIIVVIAVLGIGGLGGGGWFLWNNMQAAKAEVPAEGDAVAADETGGDTTESTDIYYNEFPVDIVNLTPSDQYDYLYLKYGFNVEVESEDVLGEIAKKLPKIQAAVAGTMSNRNWSEISSASGRERLARECLNAINDELKSGKAIGLYFTTFVAQ